MKIHPLDLLQMESFYLSPEGKEKSWPCLLSAVLTDHFCNVQLVLHLGADDEHCCEYYNNGNEIVVIIAAEGGLRLAEIEYNWDGSADCHLADRFTESAQREGWVGADGFVDVDALVTAHPRMRICLITDEEEEAFRCRMAAEADKDDDEADDEADDDDFDHFFVP